MNKMTVIVPRTGFEAELATEVSSNIKLPKSSVDTEELALEAGANLINKEILQNDLGLYPVAAEDVGTFEIVKYSKNGNTVVGWEVEGWTDSLSDFVWG